MTDRPDMMVHGPPPVFSIHTTLTTRLSWMDWLRVLFGRPLVQEVATEIADLEVHEHGKVTTTCRTSIATIFPQRPRKPEVWGTPATPVVNGCD